MDEPLSYLLVGDVEHDTDHQSASAHFHNVRLGLLQRFQLTDKIVSHFTGVVYQVLLLEDIEHGQCSGARQVVAAEGGTQLSVDRGKLWCDEDGRHGEAVGDALGHADQVGAYAQPLMGEKLAAAPISALYLVADEDGAILLAGLLQTLGKLGRGHVDTAHALDALQDAGAYVALGQFALPSLQVIQGKERHVAVVVDGCHNLRIVGYLYRQRGASVKCFFGRQHTLSPVGERGEFQTVLVGFGARVDKKQLVVVVTADASQSVGQLLLERVDDRVGVETQARSLLCQALDIVRMAVADADDSVAAVQVEILLALVVPHLASLALDNVDIEEGINVE